MKISEAIRLGIGAVEECRTVYLRLTGDKPCGCAIGTALYAVGERLDFTAPGIPGINDCIRVWPWTSRESLSQVQRIDVPWTVAAEISWRHCCGESRESIAAWLETIEPQEEAVNEVSKETESQTVR